MFYYVDETSTTLLNMCISHFDHVINISFRPAIVSKSLTKVLFIDLFIQSKYNTELAKWFKLI